MDKTIVSRLKMRGIKREIICIFALMALFSGFALSSALSFNFVPNSTGSQAYGCIATGCTPVPINIPPTQLPSLLSKQFNATGSSSLSHIGDAFDSDGTLTAKLGYEYLIFDIASLTSGANITSVDFLVSGQNSLNYQPNLTAFYFDFPSQTWTQCGSKITGSGNEFQTSCSLSNTNAINLTTKLGYLLLQKDNATSVGYIDYLGANVSYTIPLTINITLPVENSYLNYSTIGLNFSIKNSSAALDTCKYTTDNYATNTTITNCQNTTINMLDGTYTLKLWVNDTAGNFIDSSVDFIVDTSIPSIYWDYWEYPIANGSIWNVDYIHWELTYDHITHNGQLLDFPYFWWATYPTLCTSGTADQGAGRSPTPVTLSTSQTVPDGKYNYCAKICTLAGNCNQTTQQEITLDTTPPYFTVIPTTANINFTQGFNVKFTGADNIGLQSYAINWTNNFAINSSGSLYNTTQLGAATYNINITINDTANNLNSTIYQVIVNKAVGNISLLLNNTAGNINFSYGGGVNASAKTTTGQTIQLLRNGVDVTAENNIFNNSLVFGYYNYTAIALSNQNYTQATISRFLNITLFTQTWTFDLNVTDSIGAPIDLATVQVYNLSGAKIIDILTGTNGLINQQTLTEYTNNGTSKIYYTPYTLNVSKTGYITSSTSQSVYSSTCYQETSNSSNNCGGLATGNYILDNSSTEGFFYINYTKPANSIDATWQVKHGNLSTYNVSIPASCFNYDVNNIQLRMVSRYHFDNLYYSYGQCYNGTWNNITSVSLRTASGGTACSASSGTMYDGDYSTAQYFDGTAWQKFLPTDANSRCAQAEIYEEAIFWDYSTGNIFPHITLQSSTPPDTTYPLVSITYPINGTTYQSITALNYTASDNVALSSCWYSTNLGATNTTITCGNNITGLSASSGSNTWKVWANDTSNNVNVSTVVFTIDNTPPVVTIISPLNITYTSSSRLFNVTLSETGSSCLLTLDNWATNYTMTKLTNTNFNYTNASMADGSYTAKFSCNDTVNNINNTAQITFSIDTTPPSATILYPAQNANYTSVLSLNYSSNGVRCWYSTNGGASNSSSVACGINFTITANEGLNTWTFYANDSVNNLNSTSVTFRKDATVPSLTIVSPQAQTYGTTTLNLNYTVSDSGVGLSSCWWRNDTDVNNITIACGTNTTFTQSAGTHAIYMWANDTLNNVVSKSVIYSISTSAPAISLDNPTDDLWLNYKNNILFNFTATSGNTLDTALLYGNWSGAWAINQSVSSLTSGVQKNFALINLQDGNYIWNIFVNDTLGNSDFALNNYTLHVDTTYPLISYSGGMATNGANVSQSFIYINVTYVELNFQTDIHLPSLTFTVYNYSMGLQDSNSFAGALGTTLDDSFSEPDGVYYYQVNLTDAAGNMNSTALYKITLDTGNPNVTLLTPVNNTVTKITSQNLTANFTDANIRNATLEVYNSSNSKINSTDINIPSSGPAGVVYHFAEGAFTWLYKAWDWASNLFTSNRNTITIDTTAPILTLTSPLNQSYSTTSLSLSVTPSETINTYWYSLNGVANQTFSNPTTIIASPGSNILLVYANDSANNLGTANVTFNVNFTNQLDIVLSASPLDFGSNLTLLAATTTSNTNVTECNFTLRSPTATIINNKKGVVSGSIGSQLWTYNTNYLINETGTFNYNVNCTNEFGINNSASDSFDIAYSLYYTPTNYSFAARTLATEQNNITVEMYDTSSNNINYTIAVAIENSSNFTITNPGSIVLNSSDTVTNRFSFIIGVQGKTGVPVGVYHGNISLTNPLNGNVSYVYFTYGIMPPSGIPQFWSTTDIACTNVFGSLCSNIVSLVQGQSTALNLKVKNIGNYNLAGCSIKYTDDLTSNSWISSSLANFAVLSLSSSSLTLTVSPTSSTTAQVYYGYMYISCNAGDALGNAIDSAQENRPLFKITVTSAPPSPPPGTGSNTNPGNQSNINITQLQQGLCGNHICEAAAGENYLSCAADCKGDISAITGCFSPLPEEKAKCILYQKTVYVWIGGFLALLTIFLIYFGIRRKNKQTATRSFGFTMPKIKRK